MYTCSSRDQSTTPSHPATALGPKREAALGPKREAALGPERETRLDPGPGKETGVETVDAT